MQNLQNTKINESETELDYYFNSYSHYAIHQQMLKDTIRTKSYMNAILKNPHLFQNKIVLDIGSGTGILSIFAVKAGAKHVYSIQNANIYKKSIQIIQENGFKDKITVINGKVEEVQLPVKNVDIIISQWMGYFLLYQSMLDTVLYARDKWLTSDGLLFPDKAILYIGALQDEQFLKKKMNFWNDVYGVSMKCMKKCVITQPFIDKVMSSRLISTSYNVLQLDLYQTKSSDLDFISDFQIRGKQTKVLSGFIAWFNVQFNHGSYKITLSTAPFKEDTHWKQTLFYIDPQSNLKVDEIITGRIKTKKSKQNFRQLDIVIQFQHRKQKYSQNYHMT